MTSTAFFFTQRSPFTTLFILAFSMLAILGALALRAKAQCPYRFEQKIFSDLPVPLDEFGGDVAVSGQIIAVGSSRSDDSAFDNGAISVFEFNGTRWNQIDRFVGPDPANSDYFGEKIKMQGDRIVVGFSREDNQYRAVGSCVIYNRIGDHWFLEHTLSSPQPDQNDFMGWDVAIHENLLAVAIPYDDDRGVNAGSVLIYEFDGSDWNLIEQLFAGDPRRNALFGKSVDLQGNVLIVGAPEDSEFGFATGASYVFQRIGGTFTEIQKLQSPNPGENDRFGFSVAVKNGNICVGAQGDPGGTHLGAVFVFRKQGGTYRQIQKLVANTRTRSRYGNRISITSERLLVGAPGIGRAAYLYDRLPDGTYGNEQKLDAPPGSSPDNFGLAISLRGGVIAVGDQRGDSQGLDTGSVSIFTRRGEVENALAGTVNSGAGSPRNVLFLNGAATMDGSRTVEFNVLESFELQMQNPPAVSSPDRAPFAVYVWSTLPTPSSTRTLPLGLGCSALPMPLTGGAPQPRIIWNNAMRPGMLGFPNRASEPAPTIFFFRRDGVRRIAPFCIQGLIHDPGSAALVPASVTNGIIGVPSFGG